MPDQPSAATCVTLVARLLVAGLGWAMICGDAAADPVATRLAQPRINGRPVDHCADLDAVNDCSARGQAQAALKACIGNGFTGQGGAHWQPGAGAAMHYITEYDMHAGEVGGRWVEQASDGSFDWIDCTR